MREFELLEHIYASNPRLTQRVRIGPGDDMAQVEAGGVQFLAAVDQLVAERHVRIATTPLELVGRKAITRCLSDVAAMAARPVASLAAVTLPPDFGEERATILFNAMRDTAEQYECPLIGGDIAIHGDASHPLVCGVTMLAELHGERAVTRGAAQAGDAVYVTGHLGGAVESDGSGRHLTFEPRIREAQELLQLLGSNLHAMIDISDGLGRDASHIANRSKVSIDVEAQDIPCHDGIDWRRAASEGEDYELCFTAVGDVPQKLGDVPVTQIGTVSPGPEPGQGGGGRVVFHDGDEEIPGDQLGWQHES